MAKRAIHPQDLVIRCYAEQEPNGSWFAVCIDLNLVAQGDTREAVKARLNAIVLDYIVSVLRDHTDAPYLLKRRAPLAFVLRYHWIAFQVRLAHRIHRELEKRSERYDQVMPMVPAPC